MKDLLIDFKTLQFDYPEDFEFENFEEIIDTLSTNSYVSFAITTDFLNINGRVVKHVFIDFTKNEDDLELLFYFDLEDLNHENMRNGFDELMNWTSTFRSQYNFNHYVCQMDNGDENEYYFDINGLGPLYKDVVID